MLCDVRVPDSRSLYLGCPGPGPFLVGNRWTSKLFEDSIADEFDFDRFSRTLHWNGLLYARGNDNDPLNSMRLPLSPWDSIRDPEDRFDRICLLFHGIDYLKLII